MLNQGYTVARVQVSAAASAAAAKLDQKGTALAEAFAVLGAVMHFDRNSEIFGECEPAEFFYEVVTGAVRTHKGHEDGRRQIGAFYLPGDVFGLEAEGEHAFSA